MHQLQASLQKIYAFRNSLNNERVSKYFDYEADQVFRGSGYSNSESFLGDLYRESTICLKSCDFPSLEMVSSAGRVSIVSGGRGEKVFKESFEDNPKVDVYKYKGRGIRSRARNISKMAGDYEYIYMTVSSIDDVNTLDHLKIYESSVFKKIVVLLHANPKIVVPSVVSSSNYIYGNFSDTVESYEADVDLIEGVFSPQRIGRLSVVVNDGDYYNLDSINPIVDKDYPAGFVGVYNTEKEKELSKKVAELEQALTEERENRSNSEAEESEGSSGAFNNRVELMHTSRWLMVFYFLLYTAGFLKIVMFIRKGGEIPRDLCFKKGFSLYSKLLFDPRKSNKVVFLYKWFLVFFLMFFLFPNNDFSEFFLGLFLEKHSILSIKTFVAGIYPGDFYLKGE